MKDYQRQRVLTLINPDTDPLGAGYNIIQSKIAMGSGGIFGKGWTNGSQVQLEFLPEKNTDFIFAVVGEEFGLLGVLTILILYLLIIFLYSWIDLSAEIYFLSKLPSSLNINEVLMVIGISIFLTLLACVFPAFKASKISPAEALRYEW